MTLLKDRVVLVSGGTQGVGAAVARAAVAEGAAVAVTGRRAEVGEKMAASLRADGAEALFVPCDVADVPACRSAVDATCQTLGQIDCLVNAAGLTSRGSLLETTPELFDQHMAINLRGPFFLMQAVVAHLVERGAPGSIVNIGSTSELGGQPYLAAYVAAKAGLAGLTRNAAHAHRFDRIRINQLDIGWTDTEGEDVIQREFHAAEDGWRERAGKGLPMGRLGDPADVAAMVVLLLSERAGVVTGSVLDWDQNVFGALD